MAGNYIFGSGITGLLAKRVLSGNWTVVPFNRSRFYTFNPPLADNCIIRDEEIDEPVKELSGSDQVFFYRKCYSVGGQLLTTHDASVAGDWLMKVFGKQNDIPGQALPYLSQRLTTPIYGARVNILYRSLVSAMMPQLKAEAALGAVTEVGDHYFVRGGARIDFEHLLTTIPLPLLCKLAGRPDQYRARDEHFVLLRSSRIDLEGNNQSYVADALIDFYKVVMLAPQLYMFCFTNEVPLPGAYLLSIIGSAEVLEGTKVPEAIPVGQLPDLSWLSTMGIFPVGSYAQWDWCADVGSNLLRIVRYGARGYSYS